MRIKPCADDICSSSITSPDNLVECLKILQEHETLKTRGTTFSSQQQTNPKVNYKRITGELLNMLGMFGMSEVNRKRGSKANHLCRI